MNSKDDDSVVLAIWGREWSSFLEAECRQFARQVCGKYRDRYRPRVHWTEALPTIDGVYELVERFFLYLFSGDKSLPVPLHRFWHSEKDMRQMAVRFDLFFPADCPGEDRFDYVAHPWLFMGRPRFKRDNMSMLGSMGMQLAALMFPNIYRLLDMDDNLQLALDLYGLISRLRTKFEQSVLVPLISRRTEDATGLLKPLAAIATGYAICPAYNSERRQSALAICTDGGLVTASYRLGPRLSRLFRMLCELEIYQGGNSECVTAVIEMVGNEMVERAHLLHDLLERVHNLMSPLLTQWQQILAPQTGPVFVLQSYSAEVSCLDAVNGWARLAPDAPRVESGSDFRDLQEINELLYAHRYTWILANTLFYVPIISTLIHARTLNAQTRIPTDHKARPSVI